MFSEMKFTPTKDDFIELSKSYDVVAVEAKFTADADTPLSAYHKISGNKPAFLFESVVGGEQVSRFSFVGCNPRKIISCKQLETKIIEIGRKTRIVTTPEDPLALIEDELEGKRYCGISGDNRFSGGAVGYISYEYNSRIENSVPLPENDELDLPFVFFVVADLVLIFDHACQTLTICANAYSQNNPENAYREACLKIEKISLLLSKPHSFLSTPLEEFDSIRMPTGNFSRKEFERMVDDTKEFVRSGDIIQAVLSQRFSLPYDGKPTSLYRAIRAVNPSPYMFLLESEDFAIVGASPEVHVRLTNDNVMIRPIAGTRPRGKNKEDDLQLEKELLKDEKEKAEHLMLVDLARNDIGRVCEPGSVITPEFMLVEKYSHVMHIVSQVIGKLRTDKNAFDLMRATFPAGTVSGAPKVRAMQIISQFEKLQRNAYAGALGYFGFEGNHDSCIAIRTAIIKDNQIHLQSGAGIVADSIPSLEYEETLNKVKGMLKALELAKYID